MLVSNHLVVQWFSILLLGLYAGTFAVNGVPISCSTIEGDLGAYDRHLYPSDDDIYDVIMQRYSQQVIYNLTDNKLVQYFAYKILQKSNSEIEELLDIFLDPVEQEIELTYEISVPCGVKEEKVIKTDYLYTEMKVLPGILVGIEALNSRRKVIVIKIDIKKADGFNEQCQYALCESNKPKNLRKIFCRVTELLYINWRNSVQFEDEIIPITVKRCDYSGFYHNRDYRLFVIRTTQYFIFTIAIGLFHLIVFIAMVRYSFTIHDFITTQTRGNKVKSLLFWSLIISMNLLFTYAITVMIVAILSSYQRGSSYFKSDVERIMAIINLLMSISYLGLYMILHCVVIFCCMSCSKKRSSTALCIPGTCFAKYPLCSYPYQSFAFCVLLTTPHVALFFISMISLIFTSSPLPSVTAFLYFMLLLIANVIANAFALNLATEICICSKNQRCCKMFAKCCYLLFGFTIAIATNIMTIIVVISLVDYLLNTTEQSNYSTILPGLIITVGGWYFKGNIAKYTGIDLSLKNSNYKTTDNDISQDSEEGTSYELMENLQPADNQV